ncbi:MAG: hypothetical protein NTY19_42115 [Planctomycetota bacterium]|nr:hypothetical protein [Planctomycetota bacterium]
MMRTKCINVVPKAAGVRAQRDLHKVVLVVHGVGDQEAGWTVNEFATALEGNVGEPFLATEEVLWIPEAAHEPRHVCRFPAHLRRHAHETINVLFAEVFWGDLSCVPAGVWGAIQGTLALIFGLPFAAKIAAAPRGRWTLLQGLCRTIVASFTGPSRLPMSSSLRPVCWSCWPWL